MAEQASLYDKLVVEIALRHTEIPELQFIRDNLQGFKVTPCTGGSVNHVFLVTCFSRDDIKKEQHLIFKHAALALKGFPEAVLPTCRVHVEFYTSRMLYNCSHGSTPKMHCLDKITNTVVMEYVENAETLTQMLCRGDVNLDIARQVGEVFAALHKSTWLSISGNEKQMELLEQYSDRILKENKIDFDFTTCLSADSMYNAIEQENLQAFHNLQNDGSLRAALDDLCNYTQLTKQCVIHHDSHASCILVSGSKIKVIDTEFASLALASKDIGLMLAFYLMLFYKADSEGKSDLANRLFHAIQEIVEQYMASMSVILTNNESKQKMAEDITHSTGHCLLRFSIFADLCIHIDLPPSVKPLCWRAAKTLLEAQEVQSINDLFHLIRASSLAASHQS